MQVLSNCIIYKQRVARLHGISMPHINLHYVQASYANDTHLILQADLDNLHVVKDIL